MKIITSLLLPSMMALATVTAGFDAKAVSDTEVRAAHCQPLSPAIDGPKLDFVWGAWLFTNGQTGIADLICDIPFQEDGFSLMNSSTAASLMKVYYRDSDGSGSAVDVRVAAVYRNLNGSMFAIGNGQWNSSRYSQTVDTTNHGGFSNENFTFSKTSDQTVFLHVQLARANTSQVAAFTKMRFGYWTT